MRQVRDRFIKVANNDKILIISISPLVLAWHTIYDGDDKDAITHCNDSEGGGGTSNGEFEIDTLDTLDNDKNGIIGNEAATDTITAADSNPISEECQTWQIIHHRFADTQTQKGFQWLFLVSSSSPLYFKIPILQR
ncbi:MAG: hypothetical protein WA364_29060 [Candidatus Nitrosopolaris sp.]